MGRHSAREAWDESKHPRGPGGHFAATRLIIDYHDYPLIHTLAATRAWIKAGRPKTRSVSRVRAASARRAFEAEFAVPWPTAKGKTRRARSVMKQLRKGT